jgi:hypothetical protein
MDPNAIRSSLTDATPRIRLAAAALALTGLGVWAWARPVPTRITWSGDADTTLTRRIPAAVRVPQLLDQWDSPMVDETRPELALDPPDAARFEDGLLVPLRSGTVRVIARIGEVLGSYEVTLQLPPEVEGRWVSRATLQDVERTTFLTVRLRQPELYDMEQHIVDRHEGTLRHYLVRNALRVSGNEACLDNPVLVPPDTPYPATSRCDAIAQEGDSAVRLTAPDGTPRIWRRPSLEDWDVLHALVARDLDHLRAAELDWRNKFGVFLPITDEATARAQGAKAPRRTTPDVNAVRMGAQATCCVSIGGAWAVVDGDHVRLHATLDADGDGTAASWVATETQPATRTSAPDVR